MRFFLVSLLLLLQGCTALVIAAQYGFVELVIYLSNHGCDPAALDSVGDSALHWAAYKGKERCQVERSRLWC